MQTEKKAGVKTVTYCDKWPDGCILCELELCDGKKETAEKNLELEANNILRKMVGIEPKEGI